jgi:hypothetical protein
LQLAHAAVRRSGEIEIALEDGIEVERTIPDALQALASSLEISLVDVAGRRDNADRIAEAKCRRLDELDGRRWHD